MDIQLTKETERQLVGSIQRYLGEAFGEEVGPLKAELCLRFFLEEVAPTVYNQGIADARRYMEERAADLENVCFAEEFGYWKRKTGKGVVRKPTAAR
ncbi:MAG TPA: DUF2164 domain-containing protein [Holophaga sp.]|nr:DUF2164 domain-containing protein [Holophaga sp.]